MQDDKSDGHKILQEVSSQHEEQPGETTSGEKPAKTQTSETQADDRKEVEEKVNSEG